MDIDLKSDFNSSAIFSRVRAGRQMVNTTQALAGERFITL